MLYIVWYISIGEVATTSPNSITVLKRLNCFSSVLNPPLLVKPLWASLIHKTSALGASSEVALAAASLLDFRLRLLTNFITCEVTLKTHWRKLVTLDCQVKTRTISGNKLAKHKISILSSNLGSTLNGHCYFSDLILPTGSLNHLGPWIHRSLSDSLTGIMPLDDRSAGFSTPGQCFQQLDGSSFHISDTRCCIKCFHILVVPLIQTFESV